MSLTATPDFASSRRLAGLAAVVIVCVCAMLAWSHGDIAKTLGDTDDAMRLVRVRDLLAGQGWYDQHIVRLQPPLGSTMHWSRLLDGALAAVDWLFLRLVSPGAAEWGMRFVWPLAWIAPAVICALTIARGLGGKSAALIAAVLLLIDIQLYAQFRPGRIDHHNIQIVMTLIAAACAMAGGGRARWAAVAGVASGLGLAIGIEALPFHGLIGASYALNLAIDPDRARAARAYGLALVAAATSCFLVQVPPGLWSMSVCDALGWNLVLAITIGGLGLAAVATWANQTSPAVRLALIGAVGLGAAAGYLAMDPACLHGPLAAVAPQLRPIWLDRIQELRSWPALWRQDRDAAVVSITVVAMGVLSAAFLVARRWRRPDPAALLAAALVALAGLATAQAFRLDDYAFWFGVPVIAAALGLIVERRLGGALVAALAASILISPQTIAMTANGVANAASPPVAGRGKPPPNLCLNAKAYGPLAALPAGVVLAPIDLGPFVLAHTPSSALSAPYHRMTWGILAAHDALDAPAALAQERVRALNVRYVVDCPNDASNPRPASLQADLRRGRTPAWLHALSTGGQALQIYRVEPALLAAAKP